MDFVQIEGDLKQRSKTLKEKIIEEPIPNNYSK